MEKTDETPVARYGHLIITKAQYALIKNHYVYSNPDWRYNVRPAVIRRARAKCEICGGTGIVVHHIIPITPDNVYDRSITHSVDNLAYLCDACHSYIHSSAGRIEGLAKIEAQRAKAEAEAETDGYIDYYALRGHRDY